MILFIEKKKKTIQIKGSNSGYSNYQKFFHLMWQVITLEINRSLYLELMIQ